MRRVDAAAFSGNLILAQIVERPAKSRAFQPGEEKHCERDECPDKEEEMHRAADDKAKQVRSLDSKNPVRSTRHPEDVVDERNADDFSHADRYDAEVIPRSLMIGRTTISAKSPAVSPHTGNNHSMGMLYWVFKIAAVYAPTA